MPRKGLETGLDAKRLSLSRESTHLQILTQSFACLSLRASPCWSTFRAPLRARLCLPRHVGTSAWPGPHQPVTWLTMEAFAAK